MRHGQSAHRSPGAQRPAIETGADHDIGDGTNGRSLSARSIFSRAAVRVR
jgi:hypothetical protein